MESDIKKIFSNLEGDWKLSREIINNNENHTLNAKGIACFIRDLETFFYEEKGEVLLNDNSKRIKFNRKYIYKLCGEYIDIILNDGLTKGELFQRLYFSDVTSEFEGSEHICRLDKHNGKHIFIDDFSFKTRYTVKGPNTDLIIETLFIKA